MAEDMGLEPPQCVSTYFNALQRVAVKSLEFQRIEALPPDFSTFLKNAFSDTFGAKMVQKKEANHSAFSLLSSAMRSSFSTMRISAQ